MQAGQAVAAANLAQQSQTMARVQDAVRVEVQARENGDINAEYSAAPDPAILRLHVHAKAVAKSAVQTTVANWLEGI
eukprot:126873-Karenia_brevis.AAC.1